MKKLIFGACATLVIASASCSKENTEESKEFQVPQELSDSISMYTGATIGSYVLQDVDRYNSFSENPISKEDFVKGVQIVFANAESEGTLFGIQTGAQILAQLKHHEQQGIKMNREVVLNNFRKVFEADTIDNDGLQDNSEQLNRLMAKVTRLKNEYEKAQQELTATANEEAGRAYVDSLKQADPDIITAASGLSYKIINAGEDPRVEKNSVIEVNYEGRHIDGTVFDRTQPDQPAKFSPAGVIPGFAEGLSLLGTGGKATLYIPGDIAYGYDGSPNGMIGPNELLVFDVEIVSVTNPEATPEK